MPKSFFSFQWHITDECDQRCKHCYIYADKSIQPYSMPFPLMKKVFDNCLDFCRRVNREPYFFITGGDPILHPDFWKLAGLLREHGISYMILGNPFWLDDETCQRLKETGCERYQLSLDGDESLHDWFRKPGSYQKTMEALKILKKAGIRTALMATVSDLNREKIPEMMDLAAEAGSDVFAFGRYCPSDPNEPSMDPNDYRNLLEICDQKAKEWEKNGVQTWFSKKDHLWTLYDYETGNFEIPTDADPDLIYGGCNCGNAHLTILPTGDVYACRRVKDSRIGNAFLDSIHDLWFEQMEDYRDYDAFEKCAECELKAWCRGCPAVAKGFTGSFYGADPQCWKEIHPEKNREV